MRICKFLIFYLHNISTLAILPARENQLTPIFDKEVVIMADANTAFCVRCKASTTLKDAQKITMKNGRPAMKGTCSKCGTSVFRILPSKK